ncbi:MAG: hypothetical protein ACK2U1_16745 [Anaerolineales bacterium]
MIEASSISSIILSYMLIWGLIGCVLFFALVVVIFRTGVVYTARKQDGTLKDEIPLRGKFALLIIPISLTLFLLFTNTISFVHNDLTMSLWQIFTLNYGLYLILFFFDTFFIDGYTLAIWRPGFLKIPNEMGRGSMRKHILASLPVGLLLGILLTIIPSTTTYLLWMK